jgi:hypothetical protein
MRRFYLTTTSYAGIVPGAYHVHGRIRAMDTAEDVKLEVDLERIEDPKTGYKTIRFETTKALLAAARRWFKANAKPGDVMTIGSHCIIDPQRVLCGPPELKKKANAIWREFERGGGWDDDSKDKKTQAICDRWSALIKR